MNGVVTDNDADSLGTSWLRHAVLASDVVTRADDRNDQNATSRQLDPFAESYASNDVIQPPYNLYQLAMLQEVSDSISKCADAMAVNITQQGWALIPAEQNPHPSDPEDGRLAEIEEEGRRLERFFRYISKEMSFDRLRYCHRRDLETTGNGYLEVLRAGDIIVGIEHLPSYTMRICPRSKAYVEFERWERDFDGGSWVRVGYRHRPRRYIQEQDSERVWFKEFGDKRVMDCRSGKFSDDTPAEFRATEVIHAALYMNGRTPYGIPRWISAAQQVAGRSEAARKNLTAITTNGIPNAVLMMYGIGTHEDVKADIQRTSEMFMKMQRNEKRSDLLIIPMAPKEVDAFAGEKPTQPRGEFVKLNDLVQQDAMFGKYSESAELDVIGTFRLPPIAVGKSQDYTRSTAETAKRVAQEQVYGPEARQEDRIFNDFILPDLGAVWWTFRTLAAPSSDESVAGAVVQALTESSGITPRMARELSERFLGIKSGGSEQPWDDLPAGLVAKWVSQGLIPPPSDLLEALGVLDAQTDEGSPAGDSDNQGPQSKVEARARRLQRVLRHRFGDVEAESAATIARLVIRGLLDARRQLEALDDDSNDAEP